MSAHISDDPVYRRFAELGFITLSEAMLPLLQQSSQAACVSDITVLLEGETGTGKQVLAYAIQRRNGQEQEAP